MIKKQLTGFSVLLFALLLLSITSCKQHENAIEFEITNPASVDQSNALIVISRQLLEEKKAGKTASNYAASINGKSIATQLDDLDKDGIWDELVVLHPIAAKQSIQLVLNEAASSRDSGFKSLAHVRHKRKLDNHDFGESLDTDSINGTQQATDFGKQKLPPFLTEGPAWENDQLGFRLYFDVRNGKDIWGKLTPDMVLDQVGKDTTTSYHNLADWGIDLLKVGGSLGAGALALYIPQLEGKDTLVRVGGANVTSTVYEKVADGPVRAIFRLHYNDWKFHPSLSPLSITEEIQIWGGQLFYASDVTVNNLPANASVVTGIVNLHNAAKTDVSQGSVSGFYTHNLQSENKDQLGMAILLSAADVDTIGQTPDSNTDIKNTYFVRMKTRDAAPVNFRFYAAWEKSHPAYATPAAFEAFLKQEMQLMQQPLIIK